MSAYVRSHTVLQIFRSLAQLSQHFQIFFNVYLILRERERERMSRGGAETEGDIESEAGSKLRAVSTEPDMGLEPTNCEIMT